jgi:c-di-GMP-binding flagellar brake protein YcgR
VKRGCYFEKGFTVLPIYLWLPRARRFPMILVENNFKERRKFPRIRALHLISYMEMTGEIQKSPVAMARTLDISAGGTKLEAYEDLHSNALVEIDIAVKESIFSIRGRVKYSQSFSNGNYIVGIEFNEVKKELMEELV